MGTDSGAYERFIEPIEGRMIGTVWRILRDPDDAEEAIQQATARIWQRWRRVRRHPDPQALVLRICINCAFDVLRRRRRHAADDLAVHAESLAAPDTNPAQRLLRREQRARITRAIRRLPRNQAIAVLMRLIEDIPYEQIAAAIGCSEPTARVHYSRGRRQLATDLADLAFPMVKETHDDG